MLPRRAISYWAMAGIVLAVGLVVTCHVFLDGDFYRIDLDVYRLGGQAWLAGTALYGQDFPVTAAGQPLPFTYPPLAAVLFSPLALLPLAVVSWSWTLVSIVVLVVVALLVLRALGHRPAGTQWWWCAATVPGLLMLEPVRGTFGYGQINVLLLAAVCADCLLPRTRWPRGLLVGLGTAVKLTPAVFLVWFLVRGDRRAAATAVASAVVFTGLAHLLAPRDSARYWTVTVFDTDRIGAAWFAGNQNLKAVVLRLGLDPTVAYSAWAGLAVAVLVLAAVAARRAVRAGEPVLGLGLVATGGLLASPVSWSHHWVWCVPTLIVLWHLGGSAGPRRLAWVGLVIFVVGPHWLVSGTGADLELRWALWQQLMGSTFVLWALALLAAATTGVDRWAAARRQGGCAGARRMRWPFTPSAAPAPPWHVAAAVPTPGTLDCPRPRPPGGLPCSDAHHCSAGSAGSRSA